MKMVKILNTKAAALISFVFTSNNIADCMAVETLNKRVCEPNKQSREFQIQKENILSELKKIDIKTIETEALLQKLIKVSDYASLSYFYLNESPAPGVKNYNNGKQCSVFSDYASNYTTTGLPSMAEYAYCDLNEKYRRLRFSELCSTNCPLDEITEERYKKLANDYNIGQACISFMKAGHNQLYLNKIREILISGIQRYEEFIEKPDMFSFASCVTLIGNNCNFENFINGAALLTDWLCYYNTNCKYMQCFPSIIEKIFDVILRDIRMCTEKIRDSKSKLDNNNKPIDITKQVEINSINDNINNIKNIKNLEDTKKYTKEKLQLTDFSLKLIHILRTTFLDSKSELKSYTLFGSNRYKNLYSKDRYHIVENSLALTAYRLYITFTKIYNFLPNICDLEPAERVWEIQTTLYKSLQTSVIAQKAIAVFKQQLISIQRSYKQFCEEYWQSINTQNRINEQNLTTNSFSTTAKSNASEKRLLSIKSGENENKITMLKYQANNTASQFKKPINVAIMKQKRK